MNANADGGTARFQVGFGLAVGTRILLIALGMLAGLCSPFTAQWR